MQSISAHNGSIFDHFDASLHQIMVTQGIQTLLMERSKFHFRSLLLLLFDLQKPVADVHQTFLEAYDDADQIASYRNCWFWFQRLKYGDFDVNDNQWPGEPKKFENENAHQTLKELSTSSVVDESTESWEMSTLRIDWKYDFEPFQHRGFIAWQAKKEHFFVAYWDWRWKMYLLRQSQRRKVMD